MSLTVDETAGDLPVRDVGLRSHMSVMQEQDVRSWKRTQVLKMKDRQHLFKVPREQLEDQYFRLQEENTLLKQHTRVQEQKLRRLSTKVLRLRYGHSCSARQRETDTEDTIQELENRVATLESQKEALQNKLCVAQQQILGLTGRSHHQSWTARAVDGDGGVRQAGQTAPAQHAHNSLEHTRGEIERLYSSLRRTSNIETQQVRVTELELAAQSLRDTLKEKEREIGDTVKELHRQQVDGHRFNIKDNVDVIRLQKQLSDKSSALLVVQEKFAVLQEAYEAQLEESQNSLHGNQEALLGKVQELGEQLKEEKQKVLMLEGQLSTATLSLQGLEELQERVSDLERERNLLKGSYDALLESTLYSQSHKEELQNKKREKEQYKEEKWTAELLRLEKMLEDERREKEILEQERENLRQAHVKTLEERDRERALTIALREKQLCTEQEVLQHRQEAVSLQERLDRMTNEFDMSVEDLSETLMQIKIFRLQQESQKQLGFLVTNEKGWDLSRELAALKASHAETVLELQKTRDLLLMQHRLSGHLQAELKKEVERSEKEREKKRKHLIEKDELLKSRALQISSLQAQLKHIAYSPRNHSRNIPQQNTWIGVDQELVQTMEEETSFTQLQEGESLLEIHLLGATFTPVGLRVMKHDRGVDRFGHHEIVTFCTYAFLDFETHSTPLVSGTKPNYGFASSYALAAHDLARLKAQGAFVHAELHQALGGVKFITRGRARITLMGVLQHKGERIKGRTNITGAEGEIIGALDFCVRLYPLVEPKGIRKDKVAEKITNKWPTYYAMDWRHVQQETQELFEHGVGTPNELVVVIERCVGLSTRWTGLLPDSHLTYRFYDLPPHSTATVLGCADPVFADTTVYPLAVTADLIEYLKVGSLWVYVFDDSEDQAPYTYMAKTPVPLQALATGRPIKGDYILRDPAGEARGTVRVQLHWRYPYKLPEASSRPRRKERTEHEVERQRKTENRIEIRTEVLQRPVAKPRKLSPYKEERDQEIKATEHEKEEGEKDKPPSRSVTAREDSDSMESEKSSASSGSDIVIIPLQPKTFRKDDRLRVEIMSLLLDPSSSVARDRSVQQVYVEYRLLGVPMEATETPMSLRKPTEGEEIHYNFSRVIHVDTIEAIPLRHYLYAMLEGTDPNQGRLRFTVVSEPLNEDDECEDVGQAYLDLQEILLTGSDIIERQIDIVSIDDEQEVLGKLRVSLEAAQVLTGIYREYQAHKKKTETDRDTEEEVEEKL
ncbi:protein fantom [Hoplias malabaricus]|uniref:protein fantom n=1 Tax=Hoplias malabaricus TaxID=27720 RepID=UPI003461D7F3